jgi:hypothetical protein
MLLLIAQGCSINGTKQYNEDCLQTRECVPGLVCAPNTSNGDNRLKCTFTLDGTRPVTDSPAATDSPNTAPADAAAD